MDRLVPIQDVARQLGLQASTIRYYEQRALVRPASRRSGRRWYGPAEIRRLAIIRYWQSAGHMSLDDIRAIVTKVPAATWSDIVRVRIEALRVRAERLDKARTYLEHLLEHHPNSPPDGCRHFETLIFNPSLRDQDRAARSPKHRKRRNNRVN
jgi:DNA-binding transcriptional MerR regulator/predicted enzyme related to lactoylglutathione lyase